MCGGGCVRREGCEEWRVRLTGEGGRSEGGEDM